MAFKIGFAADYTERKVETPVVMEPRSIAPRKSVVQVSFPGRGSSLAYYNDQFDLHVGDIVYVDGKLEGQLGRVVEVAYNFKIKVSDYKRVIGLADTEVHGQFFNAGSHFVTFDRAALPQSQIITWYKAPAKEDDEYVSGSDDSSFLLEDLKKSCKQVVFLGIQPAQLEFMEPLTPEVLKSVERIYEFLKQGADFSHLPV